MQQIEFLIRHYGVLVVCVSALLEDSGFPFPSYPVLMVAGALTLGGRAAPLVLVAAVATAMTADAAWYLAGARFGRSVLAFVCRLSLSPDSCVRRTESGFSRVGPWVLLFVKFIPGIALATIALSGITRLKLQRFLLFDAIGSFVYFGLPFLLGRFFHNAIASMLAAFTQLGEFGLIAIVCLIVLYVLLRWFRRRAFIRRLSMDRISAAELAHLMQTGKTPLIIDIRPPEQIRREGIIPGALAVPASAIAAKLEPYRREAEIVIYCSCPDDIAAARAARELMRAGFRKIRPLQGGIDAWTRAGYRVEV